MLATVFSTMAVARSMDAIQASGTIIMATEGAYRPFNYMEGATPVGFEVELGNAIAHQMGLKAEWKIIPFESLLYGLQQDRWDMVMASFAATPVRARAVQFTQPYYCSGGVIVSKNSPIAGPEQLAGKVVAVQTGSTYLERAQQIKGIKSIKNFPKDTDAYTALMNNRVDAWVSDRFLVQSIIENKQRQQGTTADTLPNKLTLGGYLFIEKISAAVKSGNTGLAEAFNRALATISTNGTHERLSRHYFNQSIACNNLPDSP